jgi:hypothetical protein
LGGVSDGGLRPIFRQRLPMFHWVTVETGATESGVPDSNYCCDGIEGWIEFKKAYGARIHTNAFQIGWHALRYRTGGRSFLAVRKSGLLLLYAGKDFGGVAEEGLIRGPEPVGFWTGGPNKWRWDEISTLLRR